MRYIRNTLLISILSIWTLHGATIVFDLGDVLIETDVIATWWQTGPKQWLRYFSSFNSPYTVRTNVYNFLETLTPPAPPDTIRACDERGKALPPIMCDWLAGHRNSANLLATVDQALDTTDYCTSCAQRELIRNITHTMFTPELFIKTRRFISDGINFVQECKQNGHSVYLLSNWDPVSFELLQNKYPEAFNMFDGIVISGRVGYNKPDAVIYRHLLDTYNLEPHNCIFIDDQLTNVETARRLIMKGIVCPQKRGFLSRHPDFDAVREQLSALTVN